MGACVALFKEMLLLENFALINYSGISKVRAATNLVHL